MWEDVIGEFRKMWMQDEYEGTRQVLVAAPRKVLPKPWKKPHPPMWYACGNRRATRCARSAVSACSLLRRRAQ